MDEGWLVQKLTSEGILAPERLASARARQEQQGGDLAAHLYAIGAVDEQSLLRAVSLHHQTSYVTFERLAKARVAPEALRRVRVEVAERLKLLPLSWDEPSATLSVVAADPAVGAIEELRRVSGAASVRAFVALPQAVEAGLRRFYRGDDAGFNGFSRATITGVQTPLGPVTPGAPIPSSSAPTSPGVQAPASTPGSGERQRRGTPPPPFDSGPRPGPPPAVPLPLPGGVGLSGPVPGTSMTSSPTAGVERKSTPAMRVPVAPAPVAPAAPGAAPTLVDGGHDFDTRGTGEIRPIAPAQPGVSIEAYLETLKVLVSLAEMSAASWRQGHAAEVARQARRLGQRVGLPDRDLAELTLAAYLHDVGKPDEPHLTLLGLLMAPDQRSLAERAHATPVRLFEGARLPEAVVAALSSLYERYDGQGLPRRRRGRDIPLAGRMLALVDAYVDLTVNPFGAAGGNVADREGALATLRRHRDTLFDPHLVDIFAQVVSGDDLRRRLLGDRARVLLVDPDAEATSLIELKLVADGCEVRAARSSAEALRAMEKWTPDLVVAEVVLTPVDGFALFDEAKKDPRTKDIPFFFLSERAGEVDLDRAFALGAVDYLSKPAAPDLLLVKVRRLVAERARTRDAAPGRRVAGSLIEMSLPNVVEVLAKGKKTGALRVSQAGADGARMGDVFLEGGKLVHATQPPDLAGQEALFQLLRWRDGEFVFEAGVRSPARSIDAPTEWLLLEALRRLDEGQ